MRIRFDRGTLVVEAEHAGEDPRRIPGAAWDDELLAWRVPADQHGVLKVRLADESVRISDEIRTARLADDWALPALRWYQDEAVAAWERAGKRGVIALPTGAGKTLVAIAAIARLGVAAIVLVPTRVLLDQWARALAACWAHPIGRLGDGDHQVAPITVATYASAVAWAPRIGDRFGLAVIDEAHHVGAWCPSEVLEMLTAPARLGLTATPPSALVPGASQTAGALTRHVGQVVYARPIGDLVGDALAPYDLETVRVAFTYDERRRYAAHRARFSAEFAAFSRKKPEASWKDFVHDAKQSPAGREALAAWRSYRSLIAYPAGKREALRTLLARHAGQRTLVFTGDNATAYAIARELLVMPITHEIGRGERAQVLDRFRAGDLSVLVSSQVLDEGVDVPDAGVAIIVGGTASTRQQIQRLGRVLRPREGKRALIYELAVVETTEIATVRRRRAGLEQQLAIGGAA